MTEQQEHLSNLLSQRESLIKEINTLQSQSSEKRNLLLKVEGVLEYLTAIGVTLPTPEENTSEEESVESEPSAE